MKRLLHILLLCTTILGVSLLSSFTPSNDQAISDFNNVYKAYLGYTRISMDVVYEYYGSHTSERPVQTSYGSMKRDGKNFYNKILNTETLLNGDYFINIDHNNKIILVNNPVNTVPNNGLPIKLDDYFKLYSYVNKEEPDQNTVSYKFGIPQGNVEEVEVAFDRKTFLVHKIVIFYRQGVNYKRGDKNEKPRVEILYKNISTNPVFADDCFSEKRFLTFSQTKTSPNPKYKTYRLFNHKTAK